MPRWTKLLIMAFVLVMAGCDIQVEAVNNMRCSKGHDFLYKNVSSSYSKVFVCDQWVKK